MAKSNLKPPTGKSNYLGIEIECSCTIPGHTPSYGDYNLLGYGFEHAQVIIKSLIKKHGLDGKLSFGTDGRRTTRDERSIEFQLLTKEVELNSNLKLVDNLLKELKANVNISHGLHVHLDMRNRDAYLAFVNLIRSQRLLYKASNKQREKNHHCEMIDLDIQDILSGEGDFHTGIVPVLQDTKNTIEVRMKEGTINVDSIEKWCNLLVSIIDGPYIKKDITRASQIEKVKSNKSLLSYVNQCIRSRNKKLIRADRTY
jgi:hypothetical protein